MTRLLEDILAEPRELLQSLQHTLGPGRQALEQAAARVRAAEQVFLTGIGSSWHAGMAIESLFNEAGRPVHLVDASELLHFARLPADAVVVMLSRSGRSVEIVDLLTKAAQAGARVIAVTNTPDSPLAQAAEVVLRLEAAFDHNVSVTMYSAVTLVGGLLAAASLGTLNDRLAGALARALESAGGAMSGWRERVEDSDWLAQAAPTYFLARGGSLGSAHEAELLWEEAAKQPATALATGAFRHGSQEMLRPGVRLGLWIDGERLRAQDLALARDLRHYGARVMLIGQGLPEEAADLVLPLPALPARWQFLVDIIPAQFAAERLARRRGVDCDEFLLCPYVIEKEGGL